MLDIGLTVQNKPYWLGFREHLLKSMIISLIEEPQQLNDFLRYVSEN